MSGKTLTIRSTSLTAPVLGFNAMATEEYNKTNHILRILIILFSGFMFAAYSAYNVFIIIKDIKELPVLGIIISVIVALMFAVLAVFSWTTVPLSVISVSTGDKFAGLYKMTDIRFLMIRSLAFNIAMLVIFLLKLRLVSQVIAFLDFTKLPTVLYAAAYLATLIALLLLFVYYAFIVKRLPLFPKAAFSLPLSALILFVCGLAVEAVLFFVFGIGIEESLLRTVIMRPVFYLGFIGLSAYFLIPSPLAKQIM